MSSHKEYKFNISHGKLNLSWAEIEIILRDRFGAFNGAQGTISIGATLNNTLEQVVREHVKDLFSMHDTPLPDNLDQIVDKCWDEIIDNHMELEFDHDDIRLAINEHFDYDFEERL